MNALELLGTIQAMDLELDKLRLDEDSVPVALRGARDNRDRLNAELEGVRAEHLATRKSLSAADLELKDLSAKRERSRADQRTGNAKEQSQYESVILQLSGRIEELENDSLPLVDTLDGLQSQIAALESELRNLEPQLKELEGLDENRISALRAEYDEKSFKRDTAAEDVDEKLLREYDSVRRAKKGIGFVRVAGGVCAGCKSKLPANIAQRLKGGEYPVKCPACGRILALAV